MTRWLPTATVRTNSVILCSLFPPFLSVMRQKCKRGCKSSRNRVCFGRHKACDCSGALKRTTAVLLMTLLAPALARAQDTSERPEGTICIQPQCDIRKSLNVDFDLAPAEAQAPLVHRVKSAPVSVFSPGFPHIEFELWLFQALERHLQRRHEHFADWSLSNCDEPAKAVPSIGPDLCVEVSVPLIENRVVKIMMGVATGHVVNGQTGWQEIGPELRDNSRLHPAIR